MRWSFFVQFYLSIIVNNVYPGSGLIGSCFPKLFPGTISGRMLQNESFFTEGSLTFMSCMRRCLEFKMCKSLNFNNNAGECQLNINSSTLVPSAYITNDDWTYIDVSHIPQDLAGNCKNYPCAADARCIATKLNSHHCLKQDRCRGPPKELEYADHVIDESKPLLEARYTCKQDLQHVSGSTTVMCDLNSKTWMSPDLICVHGSCVGNPPLAVDATFQISYSGSVKNATYVCAATKINKGGLPYITCQDATGWPTPQVDCQTDICAVNPPTVTNGNAATSYSGTSRIATYTCTPPAINLGGSLTITCQDPGGWPTPTVDCRSDLPAACGTPPTVDLPATMTHPYTNDGHLAEYKCNSLSNTITPAPVEHCPLAKCTDVLTWQNASMSCSSSDCYTGTFSFQYSGKMTCTVSGRTCQKWNIDQPHLSVYKHFGDINYCRATDTTKPWCYTTDPGKRWELCPLYKC